MCRSSPPQSIQPCRRSSPRACLALSSLSVSSAALPIIVAPCRLVAVSNAVGLTVNPRPPGVLSRGYSWSYG
jgi:hypothetical protein